MNLHHRVTHPGVAILVGLLSLPPLVSCGPGTSSASRDPSSGAQSSRRPPFNMRAGRDVMIAITSAVEQECSGEPGRSAVRVVFEPTGEPRSVELVPGSPYEGTSTAACVVEHFRAARVQPFEGKEFTFTKNFAIAGRDP